MSIIYYDKATAIEESLKNNTLVCNKNIVEYFTTKNYNNFLKIINNNNNKNFYEFISGKNHICFYYDIEIYKKEKINDESNESEGNESEMDYYDDYQDILRDCIESVQGIIKMEFPNIQTKRIILESHSDKKRSFHIILRFKDTQDDYKEIVFKDVQQIKKLYKKFKLDQYKQLGKYIVDPSVYREGLFRTFLSSKNGENRPLVKSKYSDDFKDIETFVGYLPKKYKIYDPAIEEFEIINSDINDINSGIIDIRNDILVVNVPEELNQIDKEIIKKFIQIEFHHFPNKIRDVFIGK